ncbi:transferase [Lithospermum erythrorhizon]|uniref:Glycosyltransferase n=1 Tax=Lithospermum erythrorhizon TaxID=34254 RepID=A0AAV3NLG7_LITER
MSRQQHFLFLSLAAQGHINPTIQLAKQLVRGGARVTFTTTRDGLNRMITLPKMEGLFFEVFLDTLEDNKEGTKPNLLAEIKRMGPSNLAELITSLSNGGHPVTLIIYTFLIPWAATVAHQLQVKSALLAIQSATSFAIYHRFFNSQNGLSDEIKDKIIDQSMISIDFPGLPSFSCNDVATFLLPDDEYHSVSPIFQDHIRVLERDSNPRPLVLINTFDALEQPTLLVQLKTTNIENFDVVTVGPIIPSAFSDGEDLSDKSVGCDLFECDKDYLSWLDKQEHGSVVYVSFGSLAQLKKEEKEEISHGLVNSGRPFLWVIRSLPNDEEDGLKTMVQENGLIVPWCSQIEVLDHKAVGCFVTHCGWNSTLESMVAGVPIVGYPCFSDQPTNAKMIEEVWCNGLRARLNDKGLVEKDELRRCLDVVMGSGEKGEEIRRNALKWRGLALEAVKEGGSSYKNLKLLLD